jgi:hypothetical protein
MTLGGLPRWAVVALAVAFWPLALGYLAIRAVCADFAELGAFHWRTAGSALLAAGAAGSFAVVVVLPGVPRYQTAADACAVVFLACSGCLVLRTRRRRAQQQWRETGGRMNLTGPVLARKPAPGALPDRVTANEAGLGDVRDQVEALRAGLVRAFQAGGEPVPAEIGDDWPGRPALRVLPGGRKTG